MSVNERVNSNCKINYIGVSNHSKYKLISSIYVDGKSLFLGVFDSEKEANSYYNNACVSINKFFPSDFLQLLSVGEKTASIDKVCKKINEQYTREVNYSLANLTKWIEPIAILIA